jgi:peptidoglycan/LPS O-acetylase OafA/YrhL
VRLRGAWRGGVFRVSTTLDDRSAAALRTVGKGAVRRDIQGLRALAVVAVIADHLGWPDGGFVGVDVFFVISGFLITGLLLREYERRSTISYRRFYERRIKRIIPAATAVLFVTVCASYALLTATRFREILHDAAYSSVFIGNFHFAQKGVDYFQQDLQPSPVQHYWSLAVEEQFYLIWPWLMLGLLLLGARVFGVQRRHARRVAGAAIATITIGSLIWALHQTRSAPLVAYFATPSRAWELGIGAMVAIGATRLRFGPAQRRALAWSGLIGIIVSLFVVPQSPGFPAPWALLPVIATAMVIAAGASDNEDHLPIMNNRPVQYTGEISYSLYLWHFPVVVLLTALLAEGTLQFVLLAALLTAALSIASYHLLENPARHNDWFTWTERGRPAGIRRGWYKAAFVAVLVIALTAAGAMAVRSAVPPAATVAAVVLAQDTSVDRTDCFGAAAMDPTHVCPQRNRGDAVTPSTDAAPQDVRDSFKCYSFAGQPMKACTIGSTRPDATAVAITGDSHAASLLAGLEPQLDALNWRLDVFIGNGCRWHAIRATSGGCTAAMPQIQARLESGRYKLVITTAARGKPTDDVSSYVAAMRPVAEGGAKIVVVNDVPDAGPETLDCIHRVGFSAQSDCGLSTGQAFAIKDQLVEAAKQVPGAAVVDLTAFLCDNGYCPATIGNVIVYRDTAAHLTATYARTLGPYLAQKLMAAARA